MGAERPDGRGCVLVTGGAKRLGSAIIRACVAAGFDAVIHCRSSRSEADTLAEELRGSGRAIAVVDGDLADPHAVTPLVERAAAAVGRPVTALVNSASVFEWDDVGSFTAQAFLDHMLPNTLAPALLIQGLLRQLPAGAQGSVVNILDQKLAAPNGDHFTYTLSKYALMGMTEMLARSEASRLRVNAIAPGYTLPAPGQALADFQRLHGQTPLGYGPEAHDIAEAVLLLLTAPAITGQTLYVDAGLRFRSLDRDISYLA